MDSLRTCPGLCGLHVILDHCGEVVVHAGYVLRHGVDGAVGGVVGVVVHGILWF